jgi:hypothetical protein
MCQDRPPARGTQSSRKEQLGQNMQGRVVDGRIRLSSRPGSLLDKLAEDAEAGVLIRISGKSS